MRRLIARLRLAHGLRWKAATPSAAEMGIDATGVLMAMVIVLMYVIAQTLDDRTEARLLAEREAARAERHEASLLGCLNGYDTGLYTTDPAGNRHYIVCGHPMVVSDENITKGKS